MSKAEEPIAKSKKTLRSSILFDAIWYKEAYDDLRGTAVDSAQHFLDYGAREGRNPHPLFDTLWYVQQIPDAGSIGNPLLHYLKFGTSLHFNPHPLFDIKWYLDQFDPKEIGELDALSHYLLEGWRRNLSPHPLFDPYWYTKQGCSAGINPLMHYVLIGADKFWSTHPLFAAKWYVEQNPDVLKLQMCPILHYLKIGSKNGRRPNPDFDPLSYLLETHAARELKEEPLTHFARLSSGQNGIISYVAQEGGPEVKSAKSRPSANLILDLSSAAAAKDVSNNRDFAYDWKESVRQSGLFDAAWYLRKYKDIAQAQADPFNHFIYYGSAEFRSPGPGFDARWYTEEYPDVLSSGLQPLEHYLTLGRYKGYIPFGSIYERWSKKFDTITAEDRLLILKDIEQNLTSLVTIALFIDATCEGFVAEMILACEQQIYSKWIAVIIICEGSGESGFESASSIIAGKPSFRIMRQKDVTSELFKAHGSELTLIVSGPIRLRDHATYMFARAAAENPHSRLIYADELCSAGDTKGGSPFFKPIYSPTLLAQMNYIGHCFVIRADEPLCDGLAEHGKPWVVDRVINHLSRDLTRESVAHIPAILFDDFSPSPKIVPIVYRAADKDLPSFSIIIPTRDHIELLRPCVESIGQRSAFPHDKLEIIIVDNGSADKATLDYLQSLSLEHKAKIIRDDGRFNFSRLNNLAAAQATHNILLFVNNDTIVDDELWLYRISHFVSQPDIGAVGGKLLYPDRTIQHGGVILGIQGVAAHDLVGFNEGDTSARLDVTREMAAVTGACLAIRRDVFNEIGGFDPTAAVAFNDTLLCLDAIKAGYRNIYIKEPLLIHYESKSRGYDDKPERIALFQKEACYARNRFNDIFQSDPYYNPNLCLQEINEIAFPPRQSKPWRVVRRNLAKLKLLFLSSTHEIGHGVPVVLSLQAHYLHEAGHDVFVGGPKGSNEILYKGCQRVYLRSAAEAASFAVEQGIDCIIAETPPFFSVVRWLGQWPKTLLLDHGEPPAEFFPDVAERRAVVAEKRLCFTMASQVLAISASVREEDGDERAEIIANGNSHLLIWEDRLRRRRDSLRQTLGWTDKCVILNVCRFRATERYYKGLDKYAEVLQEFQFARPQLAAQCVFILCGKGDADDVYEMRKSGFEVFENITDWEMSEFYLAADIYANFSRWEGYNLGVGQALALGLPVIASDIPAHRAFPIFTSNATLSIIEKLSELVKASVDCGFHSQRIPIITDWKDSLSLLKHSITKLCQNSNDQSERSFARR